MSDERIKPTDEMLCTETCLSFNDGMCKVCGTTVFSVEERAGGLGRGSFCQPAVDAIQDAYKASREAPKRQEYRVVKRNTTSGLIDRVGEVQQKGWRVSGGVTFADGLYLQAMVREVPAEGEPETVPYNSEFDDN